MLAKTKFTPEYLTACRAKVDGWLDSYETQPEVYVLALDRLFVHRQRGLEDKKGTLKDLRGLCDRIEEGEAVSPTLDEFRALVDATFAELEARFT
jgi:hypothetical protein